MTTWLPVLDFLAYEVSDEGDVRRATPGLGTQVGKVLRPGIGKPGYRQVVLRRDNQPITRRVCQLVCESFHGARPTGMEVRHLDGVSTNDRADNLAWGTHAENMADVVRHGRHYLANRTHCIRGHELNEANTYENDRRRCRPCTNERNKQSKRRMRAAA